MSGEKQWDLLREWRARSGLSESQRGWLIGLNIQTLQQYANAMYHVFCACEERFPDVYGQWRVSDASLDAVYQKIVYHTYGLGDMYHALWVEYGDDPTSQDTSMVGGMIQGPLPVQDLELVNERISRMVEAAYAIPGWDEPGEELILRALLSATTLTLYLGIEATMKSIRCGCDPRRSPLA